MRKKIVYSKLVSSLGKLSLSEKDIRQVEFFLHTTQNIDTSTLLAFIKNQGVTPQVYHNLQSLKKQGLKMSCLNSSLAFMKQYVETRQSYQEKLFADLELFAEAAEAAGSSFMVVKGACLKNLYPAKSFRDMSDIDLVISQDTVWQGIDAFKEIRYRPKRIRLEKYPYSEFKTRSASAGNFGIAEMFDLDGNPMYYPFDLHLGAFPGCGDGLLELNLWQRSTSVKVGSRDVLIPSLEDCLLIICSHISRHGYAKLRDLNDTSTCLKHAGGTLDWDYLFSFSFGNSLQAILYGLLVRLKQDYEIDLPRGVLSRLKPNGFENLISKVLFSSGKENQNFHGDRQLILGRFLQAAFLYNYYQERVGSLTALRESLSGLYFLFQSGRPYRLWRERKIHSFRTNRRIVMIPIELTTGKACWHIEQIHLPKVEQFAFKSNISAEWINNNILVWNIGHPNELILTPEGIYTQSAYNGNIDKAVLTKIQKAAWDLTTQLNEIGAIQAKRVETYRAAGFL